MEPWTIVAASLIVLMLAAWWRAQHARLRAELLQAAQTLRQGAESDLQQQKRAVEQLVQPIEKSLDRMGQKLGELELNRTRAEAGLLHQMRALHESEGL